MRVLKENQPTEFYKKCTYCHSEFTYTMADISYRFGYGTDTITCPCCQTVMLSPLFKKRFTRANRRERHL